MRSPSLKVRATEDALILLNFHQKGKSIADSEFWCNLPLDKHVNTEGGEMKLGQLIDSWMDSDSYARHERRRTFLSCIFAISCFLIVLGGLIVDLDYEWVRACVYTMSVGLGLFVIFLLCAILEFFVVLFSLWKHRACAE